jgi:hypothetical protein
MVTSSPGQGHHTQAPKNRLMQHVDAEANTLGSTLLPAGCPRCCRTAVQITRAHPVCRRCTNAITRQARADHEASYLCAWLSSRANAAGDPLLDSGLTVYLYEQRAVQRAVTQARFLCLDWRTPPLPMPFDRRLRALLAPWRTPAA